jgi:hypothetical protein
MDGKLEKILGEREKPRDLRIKASFMPRQLTKFMPVQRIVVPLAHEGRGLHALNIACFFAAEITLVSVMVAPPER